MGCPGKARIETQWESGTCLISLLCSCSASQLKLEHCACQNSKLFWLCTAALPQFNQSLFCHQLQILIHLFTHSFINLSIPNISCLSQWFFHFLSTMMQTRFALNLFLHHWSQSMTSLCFPSPKISRICLSLFIHEMSIFEHLCPRCHLLSGNTVAHEKGKGPVFLDSPL